MEAKAIHEGLTHAKRLGFPRVWVESDSLSLISIIKDANDFPWSILYIVRDIKRLLSIFQDLRFTHIYREGNSTADTIANWSIKQETSSTFEDMRLLQRKAKGALYLEKHNFPGFRKKCT